MRRRPKHLHLLKIRQPVPAIVSILHRISGALLFLFIPFLLWLWQSSLTSEETYASLSRTLAHPLSKLIVLALAWAYLHHFFAGIRYLFIDLNYGVELAPARATSKWVLGVSLVLTLLFAVTLWNL
jgi:succinate dehydrogenase / fumarate reductase, cytochrome b subunit